MDKPLLLDLCCKAGGAAVGYARAGFRVIGLDLEPQPRYPFEFVQGDVLRPPFNLSSFAAIHASPPCQAYSRSRNNGAVKDSPAIIPNVRALLMASGRPWIMENVEGAPLHFPVLLCGASFGLGVAGFDLSRHRLFESSHVLFTPPCHHRRGHTIGVYGQGTNTWHRRKFGRCILEKEKRTAMRIDWMTRGELTQAVPPAYTEYLGRQLLRICRL